MTWAESRHESNGAAAGNFEPTEESSASSWSANVGRKSGREIGSRGLDRYTYRSENFVLVVLRDQAAVLRPTAFSN